MGFLNNKTIIIAGVAVGIFLLKQYMNGGVCKSEARIDGKVVIVTGANTGIGKETVLDLITRGGKVYMACRSVDKAREAADDIKKTTGVDDSRLIVMKLDLLSLDSIRQFATEFKQKEKRLDVLINNAGVMMWKEYQTTKDGFETSFGVNHLGHFLLTNLLMDVIVAASPSRVITVASYGHNMVDHIEFEDIMSTKNYNQWTAYGQSKLANILFSKELGRRLYGKGVTTYSLHPGAVATDLSRETNEYLKKLVHLIGWPIFKSIWHGAQTTICCTVDEKLATETGKYYSDCVEKLPSLAAQDDVAALKLWELSVKLVKLQPSEIHPLLR